MADITEFMENFLSMIVEFVGDGVVLLLSLFVDFASGDIVSLPFTFTFAFIVVIAAKIVLDKVVQGGF